MHYLCSRKQAIKEQKIKIVMKRNYEKPQTEVVRMEQKCQILAGSGNSRSTQMDVVYDEEDI